MVAVTFYGIHPGNPAILGDFVPHLKHDHPKQEPKHKPSEVIARCGDHSLLHTFRDSWFDAAPNHGWYFLGRNLTEQDARKRWRDKLKREGVL